MYQKIYCKTYKASNTHRLLGLKTTLCRGRNSNIIDSCPINKSSNDSAGSVTNSDDAVQTLSLQFSLSVIMGGGTQCSCSTAKTNVCRTFSQFRSGIFDRQWEFEKCSIFPRLSHKNQIEWHQKQVGLNPRTSRSTNGAAAASIVLPFPMTAV